MAHIQTRSPPCSTRCRTCDRRSARPMRQS
jgi:hypothetical protein